VARRSAIEVQGVKVVLRQLRQMDDGTKQELKKVYVRSAELVYRNALPRVPVRSGRLKGSMRVTSTTRAGAVRAGGKRSAPYAGPVHFGWASRPNLQRSWYGGPISPNPFLYAALDARRSDVQAAFELGIMKAAKKAGLR
jgi:hypothetical protein